MLLIQKFRFQPVPMPLLKGGKKFAARYDFLFPCQWCFQLVKMRSLV